MGVVYLALANLSLEALLFEALLSKEKGALEVLVLSGPPFQSAAAWIYL